jgi:uncharacterized protein YjdB
MRQCDWLNSVKFLLFHISGKSTTFLSPKGGGGSREGWDIDQEENRDGAAMTYTFKLSRRMARFRVAFAALAVFPALSCTNDPNSPAAAGPSGTDALAVSPDSATVPVNGAIQFDASTTTDGLLSAARRGHGRGGSKQVVALQVAPQSASVQTGGWSRLSATATLSDGSTTNPAVTWTASGGTIDSTGLYKAGAVSGRYRAIATTTSGMADTASINVTTSAPQAVKLTLTPASASLAPGASQQYTTVATAADGSVIGIAPVFTATGGTVSSSGLYKAGNTLGSFRVIATDTASNVADTASVAIASYAPTLQSVVLTPSTVSLTPGAEQQFTAAGKMSDGSTSPITATFTATGGTITGSGAYTAGSTSGSYRVVATDQASGKADTASVTIGSAVASVTVSPASASLTAGQTTQLTATVKDASGGTLTGQSVTWASSNTGVATVSSSGLVSGVAAGSATITATSSGKQDQATITVTAPAPSASAGCPTSGYTRLVNVASSTALMNAIANALPGDQIRMASGTYSARPTIMVNGTQSNPITLCGPRTAIINNAGGFTTQRGDWWVHRGYKTTGGIIGIRSEGGNHNVYDSLLIEHVGQEGLELDQTSKHNIVQHSTFRELGETIAYYGEGIYIGHGATGTDNSDSNVVRYNTFGPNVRAEAIQVVAGTTGNQVLYNTVDATGIIFDSGVGQTNFVVWSGGNNTTFIGNTITNVAAGTQFAAMGTYAGRNNVYRSNRISGTSWYMAISINPTGNGNIVYCDNSESGPGALSNVACTP